MIQKKQVIIEKKHLCFLLEAIDVLADISARFGRTSDYDSNLIGMIMDLFGLDEYYDFLGSEKPKPLTWHVCEIAMGAVQDFDGDCDARANCIFNVVEALENAKRKEKSRPAVGAAERESG